MDNNSENSLETFQNGLEGYAGTSEPDPMARYLTEKSTEDLPYVFLKSTSPLRPAEIMAYLNRKDLRSHSLPNRLVRNERGSILYLVSKECFRCKQDIGIDFLSPWSKKFPDGSSWKPKWDPPDRMGMKKCRARHPVSPGIRRRIVFLVDAAGEAISDLLFQYILDDDNVEIPSQNESTDESFPKQLEVAGIENVLKLTANEYNTSQEWLNEQTSSMKDDSFMFDAPPSARPPKRRRPVEVDLSQMILSGFPPIPNTSSAPDVGRMKAYPADDFFFVKQIDDDERVAVVRKAPNDAFYTCSRDECSNDAGQPPCPHIITVLMSLNETEKVKMFEELLNASIIADENQSKICGYQITSTSSHKKIKKRATDHPEIKVEEEPAEQSQNLNMSDISTI